jgi:hypothetical protein
MIFPLRWGNLMQGFLIDYYHSYFIVSIFLYVERVISVALFLEETPIIY